MRHDQHRPLFRAVVLISALCAFGLIGTASAQTKATPNTFYASTGYNDGGRLLTINRQTGAATLIGSSGVSAVSGLAIDPQGNIFGSDPGSENPDSNLYRIDAATGAATLIGNMGIPGVDAIAFDTNGTLYAASTYGDNSLYTVNPATAQATLVGPFGLQETTIAGLAVDPTTGTLWASTGSGLDEIYTINKSTGAATFVASTNLGTSIPDIAFDSTGQLYGVATPRSQVTAATVRPMAPTAASSFISINKTTGATTVIGSTGYTSVSGLAFAPGGAAVPALGGAALAMLALMLVGAGALAIRS